MKLINIGFGNSVNADRVIAMISPESAPVKRIISEAKDKKMLIDASYGRKTRTAIITDSDHVILSALSPGSLSERAQGNESFDDGDEDENE